MTVPEKKPQTFYLPVEMRDMKAVRLLQYHRSIAKLLQSKLKRKPTKEEIDYFWLKICEERYKYDFEFFAISCITIRDKKSKLPIRFCLNRAQRRLLSVMEKKRKNGESIKIQILKARQLGFSTLIQMYMKWIQLIHRENWDSVVCAHTRDVAINVRSMYEESVKGMIAINGEKYSIKNYGTTQNIKIIPERGCKITVGFATEPESVRSQSPMMVHFSEEAFYPTTENNNPELLETSIVSAIPDVPFTLVARESTPNGVGDFFYEQWLKAKDNETAYEAFFAAWFEISLYEELFNNHYYQHNGRRKKGTVSDFINSFTDYEWNLWNNHKECTLENLNWRRMKAATMPNESKMKQEFPSDDIEAFQDSGSPVFRADDVEAMRKDCQVPVALGTMVSACAPEVAFAEPQRRREILQDVRFREDASAFQLLLTGNEKQKRNAGLNRLQVWEYPDKTKKISNRYIVVFDPQKGVSESADYGVIKVIDRYWMMHGEGPYVVALFYGHIDKDITIWIAAQIAKWYNDALLVVESNTYDSDTKEDESEFIFDTLSDYYTNLYSRTPADKIREGAPIKYGFNTNRNTKPMLINHYVGMLRERAYTERDGETLNEARVFENKKDGSTGAKHGKHDDRLMATMIGLYVCYKMPIPAEIKVYSGSKVVRTAW